MDNLLVILRGCHNRHMVGQGSPCLHFLQEELGEVIQTLHREEEELRLLQAVLLLPLVVHLERLQEHQVLQVKCLVVCPDILVILTPLCTLTCIGNKHSTWAHRTDNSNNNHFTHQVMLPEVLVKEDLEGLPVLTLPNSQVPPPGAPGAAAPEGKADDSDAGSEDEKKPSAEEGEGEASEKEKDEEKEDSKESKEATGASESLPF